MDNSETLKGGNSFLPLYLICTAQGTDVCKTCKNNPHNNTYDNKAHKIICWEDQQWD